MGPDALSSPVATSRRDDYLTNSGTAVLVCYDAFVRCMARCAQTRAQVRCVRNVRKTHLDALADVLCAGALHTGNALLLELRGDTSCAGQRFMYASIAATLP